MLECPISVKYTLETIPEVSSSMEKGSGPVSPKQMDEPMTSQLPPKEVLRPDHRFQSTQDVPDTDEKSNKEMWESVHKKVEELLFSMGTPPLSEVDFGHHEENHLENLSFHKKVQTRSSTRSKHTLHTMPSYLGEYEGNSRIVKIPSTRRELPKERDMGNLHAILSTPVTCTLPLIDLLKVWPFLWNELARYLSECGLWEKHIVIQKIHTQDVASQEIENVMPVPINKVGQ